MSILASLITDRVGGYYNVTDLNRVGVAVQHVADRLRTIGYAINIAPKTDWTIGDIPRTAQMERYLQDVGTIRAALALGAIAPAVPSDMDDLTAEEANNIERILLDVEDAITRIAAAWYYSGEIFAGEV